MQIEETITRYFIKISVSGEITKIEDPGKTGRLGAMQEAVGGNIEVVGTTFGEAVKLVINEDGKNEDLGMNRLATSVAVIKSYDYIAGDALMVCVHGEDLRGFGEFDTRMIRDMLLAQSNILHGIYDDEG